MTKYNRSKIEQFQATVRGFYRQHARAMPWRQAGHDGRYDAYAVLVSEVMLQQTQVARVIPKYEQFMKRFPNISSLATADLGDVLTVWSGLGYNRRAKYLHKAAGTLQNIQQPWTVDILIACSGIGPNTATAAVIYSYDSPGVFIETNIRTVYIHHFFNDTAGVTDKEILELVKLTLPDTDMRHWYYALMDYGAHLKSTVGNVSARSKSYTKQSAFIGSRRQIRGQILKLLQKGPITLPQLTVHIDDERTVSIVDELMSEKLIHANNGKYFLG